VVNKLDPVVPLLLTLIAAYLVGSVPFGYLVARMRGVDIMRHGSGNIGATNVGRVVGRRLGILVFVLDFLKGAGPVLAAKLLALASADFLPDTLPVAAAVATFLGHLFPVYLRFRGGKGVATGAGAVVVLTPVPAAFSLLVWVATLTLTRYVSLSSLVASAALCAVHVALTPHAFASEHVVVTAFCCVATLLVFVRHHENIRRLLRGNENRLQETSAMLGLSKTLHVLALGLWFGTLVFFAVVALSLFGTFDKEASKTAAERPSWFPLGKPFDAPEMDNSKFPTPLRKEQGTRAAGYVIGPLFSWYFGIQDVCGLLAAATALAWTGAHKERVHRIRAYLLLAALISVVAGGWLERRVVEKTAPRNELTEVAFVEQTSDAIARAEAARAEFGMLHGYSSVLNLVTLLLVTGAMGLAAQLPVAPRTDLPTSRDR
jgi:acyl-phosphate glycerol 3-phosphate acyltransferase